MLSLLAITLVVCAPGYPGSSAEAQPAMDALARSLAAAAHLPQGEVKAVYEETAEGGLRRLAGKDAALLLSPLPFYLDHERKLRLQPRLFAAPKDGDPLERWTLVTGKDHPERLSGYLVQSSAGYSKKFVHAAAPELPADAQIAPSSAVLSGLRKASSGDRIAVLLDGAESGAMGTLPFAGSLAKVSTSMPMPVAVLATVDKRIDEAKWKPLQAAFLSLSGEPSARKALDGVRMSGFVPMDAKALAAVRSAYERAK